MFIDVKNLLLVSNEPSDRKMSRTKDENNFSLSVYLPRDDSPTFARYWGLFSMFPTQNLKSVICDDFSSILTRSPAFTIA